MLVISVVFLYTKVGFDFPRHSISYHWLGVLKLNSVLIPTIHGSSFYSNRDLIGNDVGNLVKPMKYISIPIAKDMKI